LKTIFAKFQAISCIIYVTELQKRQASIAAIQEKKMKILIVASEAFPFFKTGGLGDVTGALSQTLAHDGNEVTLILPRYRDMKCPQELMPSPFNGKFVIPVSGGFEETSLEYLRWGRINVFFVNNKRFFDRPGLYRSENGDYLDNDERFAFFSRAALETAKFINFQPDIIHCNDWQTALIPAYIKTLYRIDAFYAKTATVFTIHNLAYQGIFGRNSVIKAGLALS